MWPIFFAVVLLLFLVATAAAAYLLADRRHLLRQQQALQEEGERLRTDNAALRQANSSLEKDVAVVRETHRNLEEKLKQAQYDLREAFKSLAGDALKQSTDQFLALARKTFESEQKDAAGQLEQRKVAIDSLVKPIRESLEKNSQYLQTIEKERKQSEGQLTQAVRSLLEDQKALRGETANLVKALRRPEVRGRWGEIQLRRVAELAGMIPHCDFTEQQSAGSDDARFRPDMLVHLPAGRTIVVDAKTPIAAFIESIECTDDESRLDCLRRHARQIEDQVRKLASKNYREQFDRSPDFVVLFIPGESFLHAAVQLEPELIERAMMLDVVIATPTTLVSLLKAVAMGWREEKVAENARRISNLGQELHERIAVITDHLERLGRSLESSVKSYNQFVGSFESRVLVSARKFKELGADSARELPAEAQVKEIELQPRQLNATS